MLLDSATALHKGMTTGEPKTAVRRTVAATCTPSRGGWRLRWSRAARPAVARGRRGRGPRRGPGAIAPAAQGVWLPGGSVTMLHQPTARTDLAAWAEDTVACFA